MDYDTLLAEARKLPRCSQEDLARELLGADLADDLGPEICALLDERIAEADANPGEGITAEESIANAREAVREFREFREWRDRQRAHGERAKAS